MSNQKGRNRKILTVGLACVIGAGAVAGIAVAVRSTTTSAVLVVPASELNYGGWYGDSSSMSGTITTDAEQNVYLSDTETVDRVLVREGQAVHRGDVLMTYDTETTQLNLEKEEVAREQIQLNMKVARQNLQTLGSIRPSSGGADSIVFPGGDFESGDELPSDEETEKEDENAAVYTKLDGDSVAANGKNGSENLGTEDEPYRFLCGGDTVTITAAFIEKWQKLAGKKGMDSLYIMLQRKSEEGVLEKAWITDVCRLNPEYPITVDMSTGETAYGRMSDPVKLAQLLEEAEKAERRRQEEETPAAEGDENSGSTSTGEAEETAGADTSIIAQVLDKIHRDDVEMLPRAVALLGDSTLQAILTDVSGEQLEKILTALCANEENSAKLEAAIEALPVRTLTRVLSALDGDRLQEVLSGLDDSKKEEILQLLSGSAEHEEPEQPGGQESSSEGDSESGGETGDKENPGISGNTEDGGDTGDSEKSGSGADSGTDSGGADTGSGENTGTNSGGGADTESSAYAPTGTVTGNGRSAIMPTAATAPSGGDSDSAESSSDSDSSADSGDDVSDSSGGTGLISKDAVYTSEELSEAKKEQQDTLESLQLDLREADLKIRQAQKAVDEGTVKATMNGVIKTVGDPENPPTDGRAFLTLTSEEGLFVRSGLKESLLGTVQVGDTVTVTSWQNGMSYEAQIRDISPFPDTSGYYSDGSATDSYYPFTAYISESDPQLTNGEGVDVSIDASAMQQNQDDDSLYLWKAFVREDGGQKYVYVRGDDGRLHRQDIETGTLTDSGYQILSGVTADDYVAFPYGKNVKEGARTREGTSEELYQ